VPENIKVGYNTGSGDLDIKNLAIEVKSNSGSGDVKLDLIEGDVRINTGSGDVDVESFNGELDINAGSGSANLSAAKGEFKINIGSGNIDANKLNGKFSMNVGSGDIQGRNLTLNDASSFNSGSGDVEVVLVSALKHDISLASGSGDATLDFNGIEIMGEIIMKANKRHGEISAPFKFDSITEERQGNQTIVKKTAKIGDSDVQIKIATGSGRAEIEK
jgi:DUF4097 and DUF4098 domain-containing protein YvlB